MLASKKEWILKAESELRCELIPATTGVSDSLLFTVRLLEGNAEVFGIELAQNRDYFFREESIAVFTWYGCKLETSGEAQSLYVSDKTPMVSYVNTHAQLEARRDVALANSDEGPRVLIVGSPDQGKSTLSKILAAYAVRLDRTPLYIDLDVGQGALSIPGTMCAVPLDKQCLTVEDPFCSGSPLVYFFGHTSPADNIPLFQLLISTMASRVNERLSKDVDARSSGVIVNTCGNFESLGADVMNSIIKTLQIDIVLVMGSDKVYSTLTSALPNDAAIIVTLARSGGVVNRDAKYRAKARKNRINAYFYGKNTLSPERKVLQLSTAVLFQAGRVVLSEGMKFIGDRPDDKTALVRVAPSVDLMHRVLAVIHPYDDNVDLTTFPDELPQELLQGNVAGFVYVIEVQQQGNDTAGLVVLSPCPGELPSKCLFKGGIKWYE
jgi:polyribonucleotide 5'-hydroxyl-kinase